MWPLEEIRKSREQWQGQYQEVWTNLRIFVQENGEVALIGGVIFGVLTVLLFKLVVLLLVLGALAMISIFLMAYPENAMPARTESAPVGDDQTVTVSDGTVSGGTVSDDSEATASTSVGDSSSDKPESSERDQIH